MTTEIIDIIEEVKAVNKLESKNKWIGINQACDYTSLSHSTLRRAVKMGVLNASKRTGKILFTKLNLDRWLNG